MPLACGPTRTLAPAAGAPSGSAVQVEILALEFRPAEHARSQLLHGLLSHDFAQLASDGRLAVKIEQLPGAFIGKQNAPIGIESDDAFDHAAEHGPQLLPVF